MVDTMCSGVRELTHQGWSLKSRLSIEESQGLLESVLTGAIERQHVFRDNWRTLSAKVAFGDQVLILKVPRARNKRRWERLLTRFRGSDSVRHFRQLHFMRELGFQAPEPVLAGELKQGGAVIDSFVLYRFVEGIPPSHEHSEVVLGTLLALHDKGYVRNDPQLANFLLTDMGVCFIDFRLKKPRFFRLLSMNREVVQFLKSCSAPESIVPEHVRASIWFRIAKRFDAFGAAVKRWKKSLRRRKRSERA
ncbi:hypothetical protein DOQ08_03058 [Marinobacter litoralis]|uniref:Lipopolysaccharide core heptose(I) kinase RfaP n=1 Tax=Marinobacter litoralis TaxID=187981 RepID=A0A3M2R9A7_9GAMM|nr:hypothetical protein [Marinobacter litoralis]RMJ01779.1 hypothetical protein DOQ08_03058 [Marinobacter litoralis]